MIRKMQLASFLFVLATVWISNMTLVAQTRETLSPLSADKKVPKDLAELWAGFDPRAEPLETETLKQWQEQGVVFRIVRFRIGVFKGKQAKLVAIYAFPKTAKENKQRLPALLHIHGGGQYADHRQCLANAKRGYASISIAWAGRISAPNYVVNPDGVRLFWNRKRSNPNYRVTTDWGAVDGYHAPSRNSKNSFGGVLPHEFALDASASPRNSGWFLVALAARRALTFLEQQPEVDRSRLGVYGHSMGGKLTVMTAIDSRVKAAAPSCGGISDRISANPIHRNVLGDNQSLKQIACPIAFLIPANDFHGRIGDLPAAVSEIKSKQWRVICSPHHNHQDTPEYETATLLWFDQHLKKEFRFPKTPTTKLNLKTENGVPVFSVQPDSSHSFQSIDVFYTQQGKSKETMQDRENTIHRFWHYAPTKYAAKQTWSASLPLIDLKKPLWVYANIRYVLTEPSAGAGYYHRQFSTQSFVVSSLLTKVSPAELQAAGCQTTRKSSLVIENFAGDWKKHWFDYRGDHWGLTTNKIHDTAYKAPAKATLSLQVRAAKPNRMVVLIDDYAAEVGVKGGNRWQEIVLRPEDFLNHSGDHLANWQQIKSLRLCQIAWLRPPKGDRKKPERVGKRWIGKPPEFQALQWLPQKKSKKQNR